MSTDLHERSGNVKRNKLNLTLPLATTLILMVLVIAYTSSLFYRISVSNIYEVGEDKTAGISASLGNYLNTAQSVLWITGDTVDFMMANSEPEKKILDYIVEETQKHKSQFDENYTGLYGYIGGKYFDGLNWVPPEGYDPTKRSWYILAKEGRGELVIVPPYVDAQTGAVVITVCRLLSDRESVIALDVYTNHIQSVIDNTSINGKGYGMILDRDGTVVAHRETALNGKSVGDIDGGAELMEKLKSTGTGRFETKVNGKQCTVFTDSVMNRWYVVIVVGNDELFKAMYSQLTVNVVIYAVVFLLMALFYYLAYRNEQKIGREAEALKISEQQKTYETELLRLEKSAADAANKAKGDFLAQMSHEIRTPINAILGMNEMILRESENGAILEYSENIQTAGRTLLSLINSILDFSKIKDGKMEIIPVKYDTVTMINNLVNSVSERAKKKGLVFTVEADPELPCVMYGDDVRLSQVIMNLLTNAVKYTEHGSITFSVSGENRSDGEITLAVSVKDTGMGIRREDMEKLFESFSRLDETRNRNIEGTGLGMAIVTKLLALMDSRLEVESVYGEGSVFSFRIKQGVYDERPIGNILEHHAAHTEHREKEKASYPDARVLVTDDNEMNLKVAFNLLKLFGIKADTSSSGAETIGIMREKTYDILFLDHMMPKMDGMETLKKLREEGLIPESTKVIALTANAVNGAKEIYLGAGFDDYLSKPIEITRLAEMLAEYLTKQDGADVIEFESAGGDSVPGAGDGEDPKGAASDDELLDRLNKAGLSERSGLAYCAGDIGFYREMLSDYAGTAEKRTADIRKAFESGDTENYRILVHSLKSVSKTVGADDVSELAKALENAAKDGDTEYIAAHNDELSEKLTVTAQKINSII